MTTKTTFLQLVLPANNEFFNTWHTVVNENNIKIESKIEEHDTEIIAARFSKPTLNEFLEVAHNNDGSLMVTEEAAAARSSRVYGHADASGNYSLEKRLRFSDFELFYGRLGLPDLRAGMAIKKEKEILNGTKTVLGQPAWLGFTSANARLDGSATALEMLVSGNYQKLRKLEEITVSGPAATYYLYADYSASGAIVVDGDSTVAPPVSASGITGNDLASERRVFADSSVDFTTFDVAQGDTLRILGNTAVSGDYVIETVGYNSNPNQLRVIGLFVSSLASLDYVIIDAFKPTLGFDAAKTPADDRLFIGEADFDGSVITAVRPLQFGDVFLGDWRPVDVSGGSTSFEEIWNHYLGDDTLQVTIQVSQANDGTQAIEELSLNENTGIGVTSNVNSTLNFNAGTGDAA